MTKNYLEHFENMDFLEFSFGFRTQSIAVCVQKSLIRHVHSQHITWTLDNGHSVSKRDIDRSHFNSFETRSISLNTAVENKAIFIKNTLANQLFCLVKYTSWFQPQRRFYEFLILWKICHLKMFVTTILFLAFISYASSGTLVQLQNGNFAITGKGCGISQPIKHLYHIPIDPSSFECVLIQREVTKIRRVQG